MEFTKSYFGKELEDLVYQDIVDFFFEEKEESDKTEFKAFSSKYGNLNKNFEGVIRCICGFLNSIGGILIWGAPEGRKVEGRTEKIFMGELSPIGERKEKDWLINKISDSITPLPISINVKILENENKYLYIFEIEQSKYRPHQYKNTYWARLDGQTKPAPHYLIEALFKQIKFPNLEGYIKPTKIRHNEQQFILDFDVIIFNFSEYQNEEKVFFKIMCPQGLFLNSYEEIPNVSLIYENHMLIFDNFSDLLHFGTPKKHSESLMFDSETKEVDIDLIFGGRHSPLKQSEYKLDFSKIDWDKKEVPNYLIKHMDENILNADKQKKIDAKKEDILKRLLNR